MIEMHIRRYVYPNGHIAIKNFKVKFSGNAFLKGKTGSGKSTLLRMLNGLIPKFYSGKLDGKIRVFGKEPNRKDVFFISQNPEEQITCMNVRDEIAFPLVQRGLSVSDARKNAEEIANEIGISHLLDRDVFHISTGELQLVEIATALASQSKLIVLDEPFAHLSKKNALRIVRILKDFNCVCGEHRLEFEEYFDITINLGIECKGYPEIHVEKEETDKMIEISEIIGFDLRKHELVAITGDNGSGKTMMLKRIALEMKKKGMSFSIVLQHPSYHLTEDKVEREVKDRFLKDFELNNISNKHPQSLSIGQMRRVAIAKAFNTEILLLDEPTAGQDYDFRNKLIYLLRKYKKTAIIATHDETLIQKCDRVIKIDDYNNK